MYWSKNDPLTYINIMSDQIEGRNPVLEALRSGRALNKILVSTDIERHSAIAEILHTARERNIPSSGSLPKY